MRKIIYSLLVFISAFCIIDRVRAASYTMPVTDYFLNYYDESHNLKDDLDNILNIAKSKDYDVIIKLYHYATDDNYNYCYNRVGQGKCKYITYYHILVIQNGHVPTFKINSSGSIYSSINSNIVGINVPVDSNYTTAYNNLITALNNSDFSSFSANFDASTGSGNQWYYASSNNNQMIYGASADYTITSLDSSSNIYYFGEYQISAGSLLPTYKNYYYVEETPESYTFDEYIEDYNYSKMIFDFDLSIYADRENIFDLLLNDFYVENEIQDSILYDVEPFEIGYPYFEYETSSGFKGIFYLKDSDGNDIITRQKAYYGTYLDTLPEDTVSLKFIIPLLDTTEYQLKVSLVSFYPFTVSYETDEDYFSYRETLVLDHKYGAIFMPKLIENNSDIITYFSLGCIDSILVYDTYDYKEQPIEVYEATSDDFYYTIPYENINYNLFFIASTSGNSSCSYANIDYDTRYFDYQIVDTKYTIGNIVNPNTGESNHIDFSNTSNVESNFDSLSGVFEFISEQLDKNNSAYLLFYDSVNVFFNTMPVDVYVLILTVFAVILLGVTLALGGWK